MKEYTKKEVIQFLVNNNNKIMKQLDNKYFVIEGEEVVCYRKNMFLRDTELSRYSFDYCISQASQK